jgi:hypothetical protein
VEKQTAVTFALAGLAMLALISHEFFMAVFDLQNVIFFPLLVIYIFAFPMSLIYNTYTYHHERKPKDIWKIGFLGLFGILGAFPGLEVAFYGFFGLFAFFGLKK